MKKKAETEVERITAAIAWWRAKRGEWTQAAARAVTHREQRTAERARVLVAALAEEDPTAQAALEGATTALAAGEREESDAATVVVQIDADLKRMAHELDAARRAENRAQYAAVAEHLFDRAAKIDRARDGNAQPGDAPEPVLSAEWIELMRKAHQLNAEAQEIGIVGGTGAPLLREAATILEDTLHWRMYQRQPSRHFLPPHHHRELSVLVLTRRLFEAVAPPKPEVDASQETAVESAA